MSLITAGGRQPLSPAERGSLADCAARFPASGTAPFKAEPRRYLRTLPNGAKRHVVEGLGTIATQSVGSTAYTTGYHVHLHRTGDVESISGMASFSLEMKDDGELVWVMRPPSSWNQDKFTADELHEMHRVVDGLKHTDEVDYMFHVHGCIEPLLIAHERKIKDQERSIQHMKELLADPREPKTVFVTKEDAPDGKAFHRPRQADNPKDQAEYEERRLMWRMNLQRAKDKLETLTSGDALLRYDLLKRMQWAYRRWTNWGQEYLPKAKRRKPDRVKLKLIDLLDRARRNDIDVTDY